MKYSDLRDVLILGRLHFAFGGFLLYCFGAFLAVSMGWPLSWDNFFLGYLTVFLANVSVNYSNDYFDSVSDRSGKPTMFSGGSGILVKRPELIPVALRISLALIAASFVSAFAYVLLYPGRYFVLGYVLLATLMGWFYSAPLLRFSSRYLGSITLALTIGVLVPFYAFSLVAGGFQDVLFYLALPLTLYGLFFTVSVEIPDIEADRKTGKRNYATLVGKDAAFWSVAVISVLATASFSLVPFPGSVTRTIWLLSLIPLAAAIYGLGKREPLKAVPVMISSIFAFFGIAAASFMV